MQPFTNAVARANASLVRCLGNAQARLAAGGPAFTVIFDEAYVSPLGIGAAQPAASALQSDVVGLPADARVFVDVAADRGEVPGADAPQFTVRAAEPADGLVRLLLERVL